LRTRSSSSRPFLGFACGKSLSPVFPPLSFGTLTLAACSPESPVVSELTKRNTTQLSAQLALPEDFCGRGYHSSLFFQLARPPGWFLLLFVVLSGSEWREGLSPFLSLVLISPSFPPRPYCDFLFSFRVGELPDGSIGATHCSPCDPCVTLEIFNFFSLPLLFINASSIECSFSWVPMVALSRFHLDQPAGNADAPGLASNWFSELPLGEVFPPLHSPLLAAIRVLIRGLHRPHPAMSGRQRSFILSVVFLFLPPPSRIA